MLSIRNNQNSIRLSTVLFRLAIIVAISVIQSMLLPVIGQDSITIVERFEAVDISILTCEPGQESYSLYGHTAIRVNDHMSGDDFVVNYGVFDAHQENFVWHFILGQTDYEVGLCPTDIFCEEYAKSGRFVKEQLLNLNPSEKQSILKDIAENAKEENKVYRYNIFYNNCTTKARDIIVKNLTGKIYFTDDSTGVSFRDMIHEYTQDYRWTGFGNDILLGFKADNETSIDERQFLPLRLMQSLTTAFVKETDGSKRQLVSETKTLVASNQHQKTQQNLPTPALLAQIVAVIIICLTVYERLKGIYIAPLDILLITFLGLIGVLLTLMWFSTHPTVNVNFQWFLFNPLLLVFGWKAISDTKKGRQNRFWNVWLWGIIIFLCCRMFQNYAEGTFILAFSLLIRLLAILTSPIIKEENKKE